ncbi:flagellar biosynthesis protein FlhF [Pectinatus haikarae]|uniref:flagellar biosynthesis protein FlhF n=1 Tax=Pectinatus haikarae TaxID=349096 RepID=UPI0018C738A1|nr:flagellar biosynthesis protein FlhF [Pectinatus haikarae]
MQIKVFKERTAKDAMDKVRSELGPDAVILHTKKYTTGGILGYGGKKMVEVTAAIEDAPQAKILPPINASGKKESVPAGAPNIKQESYIRPIVPRQILENYKTANIRDDLSDKLDAQDFLPQNTAAENLNVVKADDKISVLSPTEIDQQKKIQEMERELAKMKVILDNVMGLQKSKSSSAVKKKISLKETLLGQEVNEAIVQEIIGNQDEQELLADKDDPYVREFLLKYLEKYMGTSAGIEIEKGKMKIVALIGATGVGKTTTLAKIASRFVLEQGLRAVLITADTYRISAVDQLKTYSDIIGLPLEIVYTPVELKNVINRHRDKQLILIDTAGRSQHNDYQLMELHDLLSVNDDIEKHLVLSATTKYKDVIDIIRKFSLCAPDKVIFTKTDETSSIGMILNLLKEYPLTLSYFTNGQSVPDDIFPAQSKNLADLLLR